MRDEDRQDVLEERPRDPGRYGFRSPDAIHLATAILIDADTFLTADARLDRCKEIDVVILTADPTA